MLIRSPTRTVRNQVCDSTLWDGYRPRADDVVIASFPRSGTTWTQRIVSLLIFQRAAAGAIWHTSPHIDGRPGDPIETIYARLDAQTHRRFLKSHLPLDALPLHDDVRYIHIARDPRDACLSLFDYLSSRTPALAEATDRGGLDDPGVGQALQAFPKTPPGFFAAWLGRGVETGAPFMSDMYFAIERSFWHERHRETVLLVHYGDLLADLSGEMRRIADFLGIAIDAARWPELVEAATFAAMKRSGAAILPGVDDELRGGVDSFLARGVAGRWQGVLSEEALTRYATRLAAEVTPCLAAWLTEGRGAGDPRSFAD